ncbi:FAD-dependent monooxygenase [Geodermatophilus sp. FMUSA9-8]|uniref:FAD-dependent monooxygenase n=1 Tax=Geodermatophilus sp. FMUSA9-8 TaxID=3120155 RepID=UPI00300861E6
MHVIVVGAGIGGLATAAGLQRAGTRVTVLERAPGARVVGSGLSLFGNGLTALDALGLGDAVRAATGPGHRLLAGQRRPDGSWLSRTPPDAVRRLRVVHRADLHRQLEDALAPGTVRWGCEVTGVDDDGTVRLRDGAERADVVVAADGIRSRVRAGWPGDPGLRYAGYTAWRGVTAVPVDLRGAAGETWGRGLRFGMAPLADGRVYWFAVASAPAGGRADDEHAAVSCLFAGWHEPVGELLAATRPADVSRSDVHDLAGPVPSLRRGRVVLLGDAAHAMTPDLGQGANQALEDAATLTALLSGGGPGLDPDEALDRYDRLRRPRVRRIARRARAVGRVAQARGPVTSRVRDAVLRLTPPSAAGRQLAAVEAWAPPRA